MSAHPAARACRTPRPEDIHQGSGATIVTKAPQQRMVVLENKFFPHGNLDPSEQELNWAARVGAVPQGADAWAVRSGLPEASSLGLRAPLIVLRGPLPFRNLESP